LLQNYFKILYLNL